MRGSGRIRQVCANTYRSLCYYFDDFLEHGSTLCHDVHFLYFLFVFVHDMRYCVWVVGWHQCSMLIEAQWAVLCSSPFAHMPAQG